MAFILQDEFYLDITLKASSYFTLRIDEFISSFFPHRYKYVIATPTTEAHLRAVEHYRHIQREKVRMLIEFFRNSFIEFNEFIELDL